MLLATLRALKCRRIIAHFFAADNQSGGKNKALYFIILLAQKFCGGASFTPRL
jgi:hypothetical protein